MEIGKYGERESNFQSYSLHKIRTTRTHERAVQFEMRNKKTAKKGNIREECTHTANRLGYREKEATTATVK